MEKGLLEKVFHIKERGSNVKTRGFGRLNNLFVLCQCISFKSVNFVRSRN